jgi:hypothetical protein
MIRPTTTLPPTTKWPKASTTWPASPCSRISRVTLTLIARRNSVVISSSAGKTENSSAFLTYSVVTTIASAQEMLRVINRSSSIGGSGMINITTTRTTTPAAIRSVYLPSLAKTFIGSGS